jgi:hypothetical protein
MAESLKRNKEPNSKIPQKITSKWETRSLIMKHLKKKNPLQPQISMSSLDIFNDDGTDGKTN